LLFNKRKSFVGKDGKLGKCSLLKHKIEVPEGTKPMCQRAYKVGPKQKEILENMVKDMIDQDIIEESCSPCAVSGREVGSISS
jgi:hypothetical protein